MYYIIDSDSCNAFAATRNTELALEIHTDLDTAATRAWKIAEGDTEHELCYYGVEIMTADGRYAYW